MSDDNYLEHIGIKRRSGRYPWGSGNDPYQRSTAFKGYLDEMKAKGLTDAQIAQGIEAHINAKAGANDHHASFKTTDLRAAVAASTEEIFTENSNRAALLKSKGLSNGAIAEAMGLPRSAESTVRGWLKTTDAIKEGSIRATADRLKEHVADKQFVDVGKGNEHTLGITHTKLQTALAVLRDEGYEQFSFQTPQLGTTAGNNTRVKVLAPPGTTWHEGKAALDEGRIKLLTDHSNDGGLTYQHPVKDGPVSVSSKRLEIRYKDDGGAKMDGVIELRRNVEDLSLNGKNYAQVRVAVDGTHYLKGMAMYADDLPAGVDIRFNTNKTKAEAPGLKALKPLKTIANSDKVDPENPFGATTYPRTYVTKSGKEKTSPLNIVNEEGRWDDWSRALSSQMLSKQPILLASRQLDEAQATRRDDLAKINALTNPVVKKKLLDEFADSADAAAVHLKAAALPRQTTAVILPMNSLRPHEIYAPNHDHGEKVVLVRHPHGGPFEIPELTVNNKNVAARRVLGGALDAVGIHHSVAEQLSGADFDGDTVLVIPNNSRAVKTRPPLDGLKGFDAKEIYKIPEGDTKTVRMTKSNTQKEMGKISNLITDMSIHKANDEELARAIRHSMVVIDAEKHGLNYKQSAIDNNISQLKAKYQGGSTKGAATIISRSSKAARIPEVKQPSGAKGVDPKTGAKILVPTGRLDFQGNPRVTKGTEMEFTTDARSLLSSRKSPQPMEEVYASHANTMKALANEARRLGHPENLRMPKQSAAAKAVYAKEVASLQAKLKLAQKNAPLERQAQIIGRSRAKARIDADPSLDKDDIKKINYQELERARLVTGASKTKIGSTDSPITPREWEAIQAGAVSASNLREILANADMHVVSELATPRTGSTSLSTGQIARAKQLVASGRPLSEVADLLGVPRTTLSDNLKK